MFQVRNYPNTFFSPTYPLGNKNTAKTDVPFAGLPKFAGIPKYEPDVYEASLKEESFKCAGDNPTEAAQSGRRLNFKA